MFRLSSEAITKSTFNNSSAGAFTYFEGRVRNHNNGKCVIHLEYEAFEHLALSEGNLILQKAKEYFKILEIEAIHRTGHLLVDEVAVLVRVAAVHREAAFLACQYAIDEIKKRLPIWKKETYKGGTEEWVSCLHPKESRNLKSDLSPEELHYYIHQLALSEVGIAGQTALKRAKILVVGIGGLGSSALMYLARAGVGTLGLCEFDRVDASNLSRQILYEYLDINQLKGKQAQEHLAQINPYIQIRWHQEQFNQDNAQGLLSQYDLVLDCTDNQETHLLLSISAVRFQKTLIQAAVYQYEGQLAVYHPDESCLCDLWNIPHSGGSTCQSQGVLGTTPGVLGTLQAAEAIKAILKILSPLNDHLLLLDLMDYKLLKIRRKKSQKCFICCEKNISHFIQKPPEVNSPSVCLTSIASLEEYMVLYMGTKKVVGDFPWFEKWKMWDENWQPEYTDKNYLIVCAFGRRSLHLVIALREQGFQNVFSLQGGMSELYKLSASTEKVVLI